MVIWSSENWAYNAQTVGNPLNIFKKVTEKKGEEISNSVKRKMGKIKDFGIKEVVDSL